MSVLFIIIDRSSYQDVNKLSRHVPAVCLSACDPVHLSLAICLCIQPSICPCNHRCHICGYLLSRRSIQPVSYSPPIGECSLLKIRLLALVRLAFVWSLLMRLQQGRWWLLRVLGRIICAPFFFVRFEDFWLGDQSTSMTTAVLDLYYMFCYLASGLVRRYMFMHLYFRSSFHPSIYLEPKRGFVLGACVRHSPNTLRSSGVVAFAAVPTTISRPKEQAAALECRQVQQHPPGYSIFVACFGRKMFVKNFDVSYFSWNWQQAWGPTIRSSIFGF